MWGKTAERRFFGDKHWAEPLKWNRQAEVEGRRHRVFCASMADVFEDRDDLVAERARLFDLVLATPWLDWQLLTKRPENVAGMVPWSNDWDDEDWPDNVWLGTTVEDQKRANERIPGLIEIPAKVRFLSCEPLLEAVWLGDHALGYHHGSQGFRDFDGYWHDETDEGWDPEVHWIIVGGESGPGHRPLDLDHARSLRDQAVGAGVPLFFKQVGGRTPTAGGDQLDGETWHQFPAGVAR